MSDERLPRNARDIIDRLGPAVTLRLIRALGGTIPDAHAADARWRSPLQEAV